ncbi:MAG TPA: hypothetical protein VJL89_10425 [Thermodesulfovibrionia bacterium]|nr:hypothetical protein [Thermodesulfovibrionia bacterium]
MEGTDTVGNDNYTMLKELALGSGACAFGAGEVDDLRPHFDHLPVELTEGLARGISIAVRVSQAVMRGVVDGPTRHYLHHYRMLNMLLDQITLKLAMAIQSIGFEAMPIAASQLVDWDKQTAHLSHKMIALRAGIGWIGRNNLLVHPEFGSHIRLATVLTDMPLPADKPCESGCGTCRLCIDSCTVNAIRDSHKDWDKEGCLAQLKQFSKTTNIGQYICGLCVKVCRGMVKEG